MTVHVTTVIPTGNSTGTSLVKDATPQLSLVVGVPRLTPVAAHLSLSESTATSAGQEIVGNSRSIIVTVCSQVAVFPLLSVTVQLTIVIPIGKAAGASLVTVATPQLSSVVGVPSVTPVASQEPGSGFSVISTGQIILGSILSSTTTSCVHVAILPWISETVYVTVVLPIGNVAGASFTTENTPQLSSVTGKPRETPAASQVPESVNALISGGHVIVGFSLSSTIIVCEQLD